MQLTKFEHACFMVEIDEKALVVDPGNLTHDFTPPDNIVAIVITHEHPDHFDIAALDAIVAHSPDAIICAHESITRQLSDTLPHQTVDAGKTVTIGPFTLSFSGGDHAIIHEQIPRIANLGVTINQTLYYPGDALSLPEAPIQTVMLPVSAPWCTVGQVINFLLELKPLTALPTHDAILSSAGKKIVDRVVTQLASKAGINYRRVEPRVTISLI